MRIWYQSAGSFRKDQENSKYEAAMNSYLNKIARPGTEVSVHGVKIASPSIEKSRYEADLHHYQVSENLIRAQQEGYDAFAVGCMLEPGFYAVREIAEIPVCFIAETSMLLACLLAPNFSLLSRSKMLLLRVKEWVKRYGLQSRYVECGCFELTQAELLKGFEDPNVFLEPAKEVAKEASQKGVCMFVNCDGIINMILAKYNLHQIEGIPVLEGGGALVKVAEMLVDLKNMGIENSKLGLYTPLPKPELASIRRLYGMK